LGGTPSPDIPPPDQKPELPQRLGCPSHQIVVTHHIISLASCRLACRVPSGSRPAVPVGFMRSSTTVSASWRAVTRVASDCSPATAMTSRRAFPGLRRPSTRVARLKGWHLPAGHHPVTEDCGNRQTPAVWPGHDILRPPRLSALSNRPRGPPATALGPAHTIWVPPDPGPASLSGAIPGPRPPPAA
jgi:hypothetical protein